MGFIPSGLSQLTGFDDPFCEQPSNPFSNRIADSPRGVDFVAGLRGLLELDAGFEIGAAHGSGGDG